MYLPKLEQLYTAIPASYSSCASRVGKPHPSRMPIEILCCIFDGVLHWDLEHCCKQRKFSPLEPQLQARVNSRFRQIAPHWVFSHSSLFATVDKCDRPCFVILLPLASPVNWWPVCLIGDDAVKTGLTKEPNKPLLWNLTRFWTPKVLLTLLTNWHIMQ